MITRKSIIGEGETLQDLSLLERLLRCSGRILSGSRILSCACKDPHLQLFNALCGSETAYGEIIAAKRDMPLLAVRRCGSETAHREIAAALWDAPSDSDAIVALEKLAHSNLAVWEAEEAGKELTLEGSERSSRETRGGQQDDGVEG